MPLPLGTESNSDQIKAHLQLEVGFELLMKHFGSFQNQQSQIPAPPHSPLMSSPHFPRSAVPFATNSAARSIENKNLAPKRSA
jgi:hypothetical protein